MVSHYVESVGRHVLGLQPVVLCSLIQLVMQLFDVVIIFEELINFVHGGMLIRE